MLLETREMIRRWVDHYDGDQEAVARYMRDTLQISGIKDCRELVAEAMREHIDENA
jgi:FMN-dependent NADH-azoreductase